MIDDKEQQIVSRDDTFGTNIEPGRTRYSLLFLSGEEARLACKYEDEQKQATRAGEDIFKAHATAVSSSTYRH